MRLDFTSGRAFSLVGRRRDYYCGEHGDRYDALTLAKDAEVCGKPQRGFVRFDLVKPAKTDQFCSCDGQANDRCVL